MRRSPARRDRGFTLLETAVAVSILSVMMMLAVPILQAVTNATGTTGGIVAAEARARLAVQNLRVQVSSGAAVCLPTQLTAAGFTLRILQVLSTSESSGTLATTYRWAQWRLDSVAGILYEEVSSPQTTTSASGVGWPAANGAPVWVPVAGSVANRAVAPFALPAAPAGAPRTVAVDLQLQGGSGTTRQAVEIRSSVAALDTPYVASPPACATVSPAQ